MSDHVVSPSTDQYRATVQRSIDIDAPPEAIFESVLEDMRTFADERGRTMNFQFEAFPGGRWFRDLGNGAGHFWAHVQVIKPPTLIEVYGPLMVSSAAISHVSYRIVAAGDRHRLTITHRLFGDFDPKVPDMVGGGWQQVVDRVRVAAMKAKP